MLSLYLYLKKRIPKYIIQRIFLFADREGITQRCLESDYITYGFSKLLVEYNSAPSLWMSAAGGGHQELMRVLIEEKANIAYGEYYAFRISIVRKRYDLAEYLIQCGSDIHAANDIVLVEACSNGHLEAVKLLLSFDTHWDFRIPLKAAAENDQPEIASYIVHSRPFEISDGSIINLIVHDFIDSVLYFIEKGIINKFEVIRRAADSGSMKIIKHFNIITKNMYLSMFPEVLIFLFQHEKYEFKHKHLNRICRTDNLYLLKYLVRFDIFEYCVHHHSIKVLSYLLSNFEYPKFIHVDHSNSYQSLNYIASRGVMIHFDKPPDMSIIVKYNYKYLIINIIKWSPKFLVISEEHFKTAVEFGYVTLVDLLLDFGGIPKKTINSAYEKIRHTQASEMHKILNTALTK